MAGNLDMILIIINLIIKMISENVCILLSILQNFQSKLTYYEFIAEMQ